jgi:hypothetical protein
MLWSQGSLGLKATKEVQQGLNFYNPDIPGSQLAPVSFRTQKSVRAIKFFTVVYIIINSMSLIFYATAYVSGVKEFIRENWVTLF